MSEKELQQYLIRLSKQLERIYGSAYKRILLLPEVQKAIENGVVDYKLTGSAERQADKIISEITKTINSTLQKGIANSWLYGINNTTTHLNNAFGRLNDGYKTEIDKDVFQATKDLRDKTKEYYRIANEKKGGLTLSKRVWNYNSLIKEEIEAIIQKGILNGLSADNIANSVKKYLNNPTELYAPTLNKETGELELSKAARDYHPGQGVYRSAYKNAMRLITTEVNAAYREAEWASYQNNPLIKGFRIELSNNHTILRNGKRVPFYDICDELQGVYPKMFKWTGWHPHCRCRMIPILLTDEEFASRIKARKEGTLDKWKVDEIKDMPDNYKKYVDENKARFGKLKNKPSWLLDDKQGQKDVNFYTKEGSGKMNSYLRGIRSTIDAETKTKISNISNYLNNAEKYKGTTYRGITLTEAQFQEYLSLKKGNMYIDKGFVSTTKSEGIINRFLGSSQYQAKFIIHSKNGVDIAPISDNKTEQEILFNKETKFIINKIKVNKKGYAKSIIIELLEP